MPTYYSSTITIWSELNTRIGAIVWLSGRVHKSGAWVSVSEEDYPRVITDLVRDGPELYLANQGSYYLQPEFDIIYQQRANENKETEMALKVSGVGAIIDEARAYMSHCPYWERIQVMDVDYKWYSPGTAPALITEAKIHVKAKKEWAG